MEPFKAKLGPLPVWAWGGIITAGAVAFFYWRSRSSSADSAAAGDTTDQGAIAGQLGALGYYDGSGVQTGTGGSTSGGGGSTGTGGGGTKTDPRNCAHVKDPSGKTRHVCGFGHWYRKAKGGHWFWTPGPIPTNGLHAAWQYRTGPPGHGQPATNPRLPTRTHGGTQQPLTATQQSALMNAAVAGAAAA